MADNHFRINRGISLAVQTSSPSNPVDGDIYYDSGLGKFRVYQAGAWTNMVSAAGGGGGSGGGVGPNLITLDSSYAATKSTNSDAETTVGDWVAYADAAGTAPVDMTGGSPNTTIVRSVATPLDGAASFLVTVTTGASRQGEGVSCIVSLPPVSRGKTVTLSIPFSTTGTLVEDDFKLYAHVIDGASAGILTPFTSGKILGASGLAQCIIPVPTDATQMRVGIHVARTSTGAATIKFDDVALSIGQAALGMAGSDETPYTLVIGGDTTAPTPGTTTNNLAVWSRIGNKMLIRYTFRQSAAGSAGAGVYLFPLPTGYSIDTALAPSSTSIRTTTIVGESKGFSTAGSGIDMFGYVGVYSSTNLGLVLQTEGNSNQLVGFAGTGNIYSLGNNEVAFSFTALVPISGWSSNVSMSESSTFRISSYLATGTRVTSAPTRLGEYRSRSKTTVLSNTFADAAPTTAPSASNGMRLHAADYTSAQTSGLISLYDIFIGKNKTWRSVVYHSAALTGGVSFDYFVQSTTIAKGTRFFYDETTGVLTIESGINDLTANTSRNIGIDMVGADRADGYLDIIVSENALAVGVQSIRSNVRAHTSNGQGSTNTAVDRFTTVTSSGDAIVYTDSATLGAKFTTTQDGIYSIHISRGKGTASGTALTGIVLNGASPTSSIASISNSERLNWGSLDGTTGNQSTVAVSWEGFLSAGSVIWMQGSPSDPLQVSANIIFQMTKTGN